jgi:hypothetical protein
MTEPTHTYSVRTWDTDEQRYTPQDGLSLPWRGLTLWQLRQALRELQGMGYTCHRYRDSNGDHADNDYYVLVERDDEETDGVR